MNVSRVHTTSADRRKLLYEKVYYGLDAFRKREIQVLLLRALAVSSNSKVRMSNPGAQDAESSVYCIHTFFLL